MLNIINNIKLNNAEHLNINDWVNLRAREFKVDFPSCDNPANLSMAFIPFCSEKINRNN